MVQWLRLHASNGGGTGSIPGWGTKIPHATWHGQKNGGGDTSSGCVYTEGRGGKSLRSSRGKCLVQHPMSVECTGEIMSWEAVSLNG